MAHPTYTLLFVSKKGKFSGGDKRAYIAALRQAKFYLPWQAAAAAACVFRCPSTQGAAVHEILSLMYCGSCAAATYLQIHSCRSTRGI